MDTVSRQIRENMIRISNHSGHGHLPTCFSIVEMIRAAYDCMKHDPENPSLPDRDIFILSKGHGALALYCTLSHYGYFPIAEVYGYGSFQSRFGCHPDRHTVPGVELSTGSLGHGIGVAAGIALGFKLSASNRRVFVLIGDGESNEGSVWEAAMVASRLQLANLTILFDNNCSQTRGLPITDPEAKFTSFGCDVASVDGHDVNALTAAINKERDNRPRTIVANTIKGKGCTTLEREMFAWHRRSPNKDEHNMLIGELK